MGGGGGVATEKGLVVGSGSRRRDGCRRTSAERSRVVSNARRVAGRFETSEVDLRELILGGTAATVGRFSGWHAWTAGGSRGGWLEAFRSSGTRVRAAIVKGANTPTKAAFRAFFICAAGAFLIVSKRKYGLTRGERFID